MVTMEDIQMMAADEEGMLLSFSTLILAYLSQPFGHSLTQVFCVFCVFLDDQVPLPPINSRLSSRGFSMKKHAKLRLKSSKGMGTSRGCRSWILCCIFEEV